LLCSDVRYAPINANGSLVTTTYGTASTFAPTTSFNTGRNYHTTVAYNGYLYVIGGWNGAATYYNDVQYAPIYSNGTIGAWTTDGGGNFTTPRRGHASVAYNGYLYVIGGSDAGSYLNDIQYAPINTDGSIGAWTADGGGNFTDIRSTHISIAYNGYLYVMGGWNGTTRFADVQYAPINSDGTIGAWNPTTSFTTARLGHTSVAYNGYMYIVGGSSSGGYLADVQYATINSNGTVGTWNYTHDSINDGATFVSGFSTARQAHSSAAYNGYLYVMGGFNGGNLGDTQYARINSDGTVGTWATNGVSFSTSRFSHSSVSYNGYLYVMGGFGGSYRNDVQYALLQTMPARARYEKVLDTGFANTSLQDFVINGQGVCGYTVSYATASSIAGTTNRFGYTVLTNRSVAPGAAVSLGNVPGRYLRLIVTLDDQTCGTQSTITDITLNYGYLPPDAPDPTSPGQGPTVNAWNATTSFTTARNAHTSIAYNGYLYVIGGSDGGYLATVQYAPINSNGTIGAWSATTSFTTARYGHTSVAYNGYLYVIGGCSAGVCTGNQSDVQYAPINSNGTIGSWSATTSFTTGRHLHTSVAYNGYLYVIGGCSAGSGTCTTYQSDVQYAPINSNGTIGSWTTNSNSITNTRTAMTSVAYNGYLYVIGGVGGSYFADVQYATINSNGTIGAFANTTSFSTARYGHTSVAYNGYLYVIGGRQLPSNTDCKNSGSSSYCNDVQYAPINSDGTIGAWTTTAYFTTARATHTSVAYNGYLYVIGGFNGSNLADTQYAQFAASTTPIFKAFSSQQQNSYLRYKYELCYDVNCNSVVRRVDQTAGQTNWSGQDQQATTAYTGHIYPEKSTVGINTYTAPALNPGTTYFWRAYAIDPAYSNSWSSPSKVAAFTTNFTASVPALFSPANSATAVATLPSFQLAASDPTSDYLRYRIEVCSVSDCSVIVRTIDQTSSQTGWQGQGTQAGTAYNSGPLIGQSQVAVHQYQAAALSLNTQYWWRAYSIDPGGSNVWSAASSINTFTTAANSPSSKIQGGTNLRGGTRIGN
jgi:Kelch motif